MASHKKWPCVYFGLVVSWKNMMHFWLVEKLIKFFPKFFEKTAEYFSCEPFFIFWIFSITDWCMRVSWKVHRLTKMVSWNAIKWSLFVNIVPLTVCTLCPSVLQCLIVKKSHYHQIWHPHTNFSPLPQYVAVSSWPALASWYQHPPSPLFDCLQKEDSSTPWAKLKLH